MKDKRVSADTEAAYHESHHDLRGRRHGMFARYGLLSSGRVVQERPSHTPEHRRLLTCCLFERPANNTRATRDLGFSRPEELALRFPAKGLPEVASGIRLFLSRDWHSRRRAGCRHEALASCARL